jgi:hypothetical protein
MRSVLALLALVVLTTSCGSPDAVDEAAQVERCDQIAVEIDVPPAAGPTEEGPEEPAGEPTHSDDAPDPDTTWGYIDALDEAIVAGSYLDEGRRIFLFTQDTQDHVDELRRRADHPDRIGGATVEHSINTLVQTYEGLANDPDENIEHVALDVSKNRVGIGVDDPDDPNAARGPAARHDPSQLCVQELMEEDPAAAS